jgi:UDP-N-acetylmuramoylalanine--D-glutamate ligase
LLVVGLGLSGVSALRYLARQGADLVVTDSRPEPKDGAVMQAEYPQFEYRFGGFSAPEPLSQFVEAVVSPGVDLREPFLQQLRDAGVAIVGDVELFARHLAGIGNGESGIVEDEMVASVPIPDSRFPIPKVIGITGSNGKSTVTTLVGEMAKATGLVTAVGGNLGTPALDLLADGVELYVLELSSFQLETTHSLRCTAATILNLSEDHLDRHGSMAAYAAAKARIFKDCRFVVGNRDDAAVMALLPEQETRWSFGLTPPDWQAMQSGDHALAYFAKGTLEGAGDDCIGLYARPPKQYTDAPARIAQPLLPVSEVKIAGSHNLCNVMAAVALSFAFPVATSASDDAAAALRAIGQFKGLPHRCAFVAEINGARYYNDSKGTNVGSTLAAIQGLPAPVIWLGGGQGKGQDFSPLAAALAAKADAAIVFGEDAAAIEAAILGSVPVYREPTMAVALRRAHSLAGQGASILLSPACASFDQFKSYLDRGQQFEAAVRSLAGEAKA